MLRDITTENDTRPGLTVEYTTVADDATKTYAHSLKVRIAQAKNMSDHLFVYQRSTQNNEGDAVDTFIQIASPLEIEEVPEDAPDLMNGMPYYRKQEVVLWFRNLEDLKLAKEKIKDDLNTLVLTYKLLNDDPGKKETETYE